ncbi:hypothetical protein N0V85_007645 [Neurospora sp. IMI 360204]|nr:hypothetical protein N0V85_007645 [Neurospora sp. IMI 360204]
MASNDPATDDTPNSNSTQMEHVPAPAVPAHPAVTSTSFEHLGDFATKLVESAYKVQSLISELEQTKEKLREAEKRIAKLEIDRPSRRIPTTIDEQVKKFEESANDINTHFNALYDAFDSDLAKARNSRA